MLGSDYPKSLIFPLKARWCALGVFRADDTNEVVDIFVSFSVAACCFFIVVGYL